MLWAGCSAGASTDLAILWTGEELLTALGQTWQTTFWRL
jgi:hypothetical protein